MSNHPQQSTNKIHPTGNAMTTTHLSIKILASTISIAITNCILVAITHAQTASPSPETKPPQPTQEQPIEEKPQQNNYIGFGGVVGIQGSTTSLSQGTFSVFSKNILTENLSIHTSNTIFGSLTSSSSVALTYNQPISSDNLPIVFTPFLGGGVTAYYENGTRIVPHITGGVDLGTPGNITGTIRMNASFVNDRQADVGILFGLGYNY
jgi:hypothetical protein